MTIYIDSDYKCHTTTADGLTAVETDVFDGMCAAPTLRDTALFPQVRPGHDRTA